MTYIDELYSQILKKYGFILYIHYDLGNRGPRVLNTLLKLQYYLPFPKVIAHRRLRYGRSSQPIPSELSASLSFLTVCRYGRRRE